MSEVEIAIVFGKSDSSPLDKKFLPVGLDSGSWLCAPSAIPVVGDFVMCDIQRMVIGRTWLSNTSLLLRLQIGSAE